MASETKYGRFVIRTMKSGEVWKSRALRGDTIASDIETGGTADESILAVKAALDRRSESEHSNRGPDGFPTATEVREALRHLKMSEGQNAMLMAHFKAADQILTATQLADAAGYESFSAANLQYGFLGSALSDELEWVPPQRRGDEVVWTYTLATNADDAAAEHTSGEFRWRLRPQIVEALRGDPV